MKLRSSRTRLRSAMAGLSGLAFAAAVFATEGADSALSFPPAPQVAARGLFATPESRIVRVGDTVEYRLRVSWRDAQAAVRVLPPRADLVAPGFDVLGPSTLHRKTAGPDGILSVTEFTYRLVARVPGRGGVAPFSLRYLDGISGREGTVEVAGSGLDIAPARKPLAQRTGFRAGAAALLLATAGVAAFLYRKARRRREKPEVPRESGPARELRLLRERCEVADSRAWLADAERLCLDFLARDLGLARTGQVRFEAALEQYLARHPGLDAAEIVGWTTLRDLFHEARFSGGRKEPHALREACRHLKTCLKIPGEET